jgi:hypothetical protein
MTQMKLTAEDVKAISEQRKKEEQRINLWKTDLDTMRAEADRMFRHVSESRSRGVSASVIRREVQELCPYIAKTSTALLDIAVKDADVARSRSMLEGILVRIEDGRREAAHGELDKGKYRDGVERYILGDKLEKMTTRK